MRPWTGWISVLVVCLLGCDGGASPGGGSACSFQSISRSGGLCTLSVSCAGMPVGLACSDADCVCTADGVGGARFDVAGACAMSTDALTALYSASCPAASVDSGDPIDATASVDAPVVDVAITPDVPDVPDVPMCGAFSSRCSSASQCCNGAGCANTVTSPESVCCIREGRSCGTTGSCCLPYFCRVLSGNIRACR